MVREVVLDTETTGLDPEQGHRLVEIGCLELLNHVPSGRTFHVYINPERDMPEEAFAVHGLASDFLKDHPPFRDIGDDFLKFIGDAPLVIHNAKFDIKFLNAELLNHGWSELPFHRAIDTLTLARQKFPGSPASLDALCKKFGIDVTKREKHGALLDAELLAQVYLELIGGKQPTLSLHLSSSSVGAVENRRREKPFRIARPHAPTSEELELHKGLIALLKEPVWRF